MIMIPKRHIKKCLAQNQCQILWVHGYLIFLINHLKVLAFPIKN